MKKILAIANTIALLLTIVINYISNSGLLNGNTMKTISDKYANYFTPAGYAFSIWGLIYLGLLGFVVYTAAGLNKEQQGGSVLLQVKWWFVVSCLANSLWVVAWLYDYIGLSVVLMAVIFISLLNIIISTGAVVEGASLKKYLLVFAPFSLYFGWISVAFIANMAAYLTATGWDGWGISAINWTVIMIAVAGLVNIFVIWTRNLYLFGAVGIWAILAIAASNEVSLIINTCYAVAVVLAIVIIIRLLAAGNKKNNSPIIQGHNRV